MREFSSPLNAEIPTTGNLTDDVVRRAARGTRTACRSACAGATTWDDVTAAQFLADVRSVAKGLVASGVQAGDRVALLSRTRYEWTLLDYAIWFAGAVTVPIYETSSVEQIAWILEDSGAVAVVVEIGRPRRAGARGRRGQAWAGALAHVWLLDDGAVDALSESGASLDDETVEQRRQAVTPDSLATLIYTSGTTGRPKGCVLTHGNFMFELGSALADLPELFEGEDASTLLFLPLAHVFARIIQVGCVKAGVRLGHSADIKTPGRRPRRVPAQLHPGRAPGVREGVQHRLPARRGRRSRGDLRPGGQHRDRLQPVAGPRPHRPPAPGPARSCSTAWSTPSSGPPSAAAARYAVSGGAPLGERLGHFYRGIGVSILEGYGLTETTAAITANRPGAQRIGTVGQPARRYDDPGRRRRRAARAGRPGHAGLLAQRRRHRGDDRRGRLAAHR